MVMRIGRTLPPAASPLQLKDLMSGVAGCFEGESVVKRFEDELKSFYQVRCCAAVSSGKAALVLILRALHEIYPEKDEILIPAYTCYSVPSAIIRAGFKVRLCDLEAGTLDFDFKLLEEQLENPFLLCVIPTHLFGWPADVARVMQLARAHHVFVVEDAAQAMGAEFDGKKIGTAGDVGIFSMGRGKAFSTVEGGIILTDNDMIGQAIEKQVAAVAAYTVLDSLKLFVYAIALSILIHPLIYWLPKSLPFLKLGETHFNTSFPVRRLSSFQAGLAKRWKNKIEKTREVRMANAKKLVSFRISPPGTKRDILPDLVRFPVLLADTETKKKVLAENKRMGLGISDGYPDSIDGIPELGIFADKVRFKKAKDIAERIVCLPVHKFVKDSDLRKIVSLLG